MSVVDQTAGQAVVQAAATSMAAVPYGLADSPLWACADEHSLWGRIVTDPREIDAIRARIAYHGRRRGGAR